MPQDKVRVTNMRWGTISNTSQPNIQAEISSGFRTAKAQRGLRVACLQIGDNEKCMRVGLRPRMLFLFYLESELRWDEAEM
jgi:hypothetical protein